jgi:hypothetical protein
MIVNLRGTHGSGKSTVVAKILAKYDHEPLESEQKRSGLKTLVYSVMLRPRQAAGERLIVIGNYDTACGGCDGIQPYDRIWPLVDRYGTLGYNVLFEGALVSSSYGNIGRASEPYGDNFVFAFMDTPLDVCLLRIKARRLAKGNEKPLDPTNTEFKFHAVAKSRIKMEGELGRRCVTINHLTPVRDTLKLFGIHLRKEP